MPIIDGILGKFPDVIEPVTSLPTLGFVLTDMYGSMYSVAITDTDAKLDFGFFVRKGGKFKVLIISCSSAANNGYTLNAIATLFNAPAGGNISSTFFSGSAFNLTLKNAWIASFDFSTAIVDIPSNTLCHFYWNKTDNGGSATGTLYICGVYLVRWYSNL